MKTTLRASLVLFLALMLLTGIAYPLLVTGLGQALFPVQAAGSLLFRDGRPIGSALIGQHFAESRYVWGRPSATAPMPNNAQASGGSNLGPSNPALLQAVEARIAVLRVVDPGNTLPIPVDLVTASASGLDPDISLAGARYQAARVARARGLSEDDVLALIDRHARGGWLGFLGEPRVNVLALNLTLDGGRP
ncbi:potassium-transporting ATPase subunit KdpC [Methylibium petroleiphilum]|uniref:potassium-transporting ATPase subunit KdpC n=1 Tax=Methylibium petroleiphilum TaxID=105560 RepID=UPI003D28A24A